MFNVCFQDISNFIYDFNFFVVSHNKLLPSGPDLPECVGGGVGGCVGGGVGGCVGGGVGGGVGGMGGVKPTQKFCWQPQSAVLLYLVGSIIQHNLNLNQKLMVNAHIVFYVINKKTPKLNGISLCLWHCGVFITNFRTGYKIASLLDLHRGSLVGKTRWLVGWDYTPLKKVLRTALVAIIFLESWNERWNI